MRYAYAFALRQIDHLQRIPWLIAQLDVPGVRDRCLEMYRSCHRSLHDRVSQACFDPEGPYFAIILGAGTFGTRGGPEIDPRARILHATGRPIPGLYGAGNCIASPAAGGYWGGGSQIGPGMVFGGIAGLEAASQPPRPWI